MGKKAAIGVLIVIIAVVGIYLQYWYPWEPVTESRARDIIKDRYPVGDEDIATSYEEDCMVCDEYGCRTLETCWKANFTINQTTHGIVIDGGSGGIVQETEGPCVEWWCTAEPCTYFYREVIPGGSKSYYNTGCEAPEPVCDQQYERCKECENPPECIRKTVTRTNETVYYYEVIGVDGWGSISETDYFCRIFDEGAEVFYNITTVEQCESIMVYWSKCYGTCDFEPTFGMIPY